MPPTEPVTVEQPKQPLHAVVSELEADYPQWRFAIRQGYGGQRVEAHRPQSTSGLYALITADPAELRRELDNATPGRDRSGGSPTNDLIRPHDVGGLTAGELERARRELRASLALVRPDSPARVPILAHLSAIDGELARRSAGGTEPTR
jgi:hypothetical protein